MLKFEPLTATASQLQELLTIGAISSTDLVEVYVNRIHQYDGYLKAVLSIAPTAMNEAARLDKERLEGGVRGPLHGIPILIKVSLALSRTRGNHFRLCRTILRLGPTSKWIRQPAAMP